MLVGGAGCAASSTSGASGHTRATLHTVTTARSTAPTSSSSPSTVSAVDPESGLRWISTADLPGEAVRTLQLIKFGGPYPYDQDGVTFENREQILPDRPLGYYREFTVETPGSDDRGARRIVVGNGGEQYYTDDHYDSFYRIAAP